MNNRYMMIKKGGRATHKLGDISRNTYNAELIIVQDETDTDYIGQFAEGFGFINIKFDKNACRLATDAEVEMCKKGQMEEIVY